MKKYFNMDLYTGQMAELTKAEFEEQIEGWEDDEQIIMSENDGTVTYKFEEDVVIEITV